jgi:hypothetical protein
MKLLPTSLKEKIAHYMLRKTRGYDREKKGVNLRGADQILLVYAETDEAKFKLVKDIANYLKKEYDIKHIMRVAYVDVEEKSVPTWHMRKLESDFFCKSDLNWQGRPVKNVQAIQEVPYDILIHLDPDAHVALDYFVAHSHAKMKVANRSEARPDDFDILLPAPKEDSWKQRNHRIIEFLSDSPLT